MRADESYDVDKNTSTPCLDSRPSPALSVEEDSEPRSSSAPVRLGRQTRSVEVDKTYYSSNQHLLYFWDCQRAILTFLSEMFFSYFYVFVSSFCLGEPILVSFLIVAVFFFGTWILETKTNLIRHDYILVDISLRGRRQKGREKGGELLARPHPFCALIPIRSFAPAT